MFSFHVSFHVCFIMSLCSISTGLYNTGDAGNPKSGGVRGGDGGKPPFWLPNHHALLLSGSSGYSNYRHQVSALGMLNKVKLDANSNPLSAPYPNRRISVQRANFLWSLESRLKTSLCL